MDFVQRKAVQGHTSKSIIGPAESLLLTDSLSLLVTYWASWSLTILKMRAIFARGNAEFMLEKAQLIGDGL